MFETPPTMKITPIKEISDENCRGYSRIRSSEKRKSCESFANVRSTSTPIGVGKENAKTSERSHPAEAKKGIQTGTFLGLSTVKSALTHIGQVGNRYMSSNHYQNSSTSHSHYKNQALAIRSYYMDKTWIKHG